MASDDSIRQTSPGYADRDITKVPGWHGLVAWDLLFNNLTTGLFLFTAVGELAFPALLGPGGQGGLSRRACLACSPT